MPTGERKVTLTAGLLVILLFGAPLLGIATDPEELEPKAESRYTSTSPTMNITASVTSNNPTGANATNINWFSLAVR